MAEDVQGAEKALPWLKKAHARYVTLIDRENQLGSRFQVNYVPLTILYDETGRVVRGPQHFNGSSSKSYEELSNWLRNGQSALTQKGLSKPEKAMGFESPEAELRFQLAALLIQQGNKPLALRQLKSALQKSPNNFIILKQIWAIENPERFYSGKVDFKWQREQLKQMTEKPE